MTSITIGKSDDGKDQAPMSDEQKKRMKPVIILPKGELSESDIALLRDNDFCVVEANNPDAVRFMEPPPQGYTAQETAAIKLCRYIVNMEGSRDAFLYRDRLVNMLAKFMIDGTSLAEHAATKPVKKVKGA